MTTRVPWETDGIGTHYFILTACSPFPPDIQETIYIRSPLSKWAKSYISLIISHWEALGSIPGFPHLNHSSALAGCPLG